MIHIRLLGLPIVERNGNPLPPFKSRKVLGLLAYLALNPGTHSRSRLAGLLWSDVPEKKALSNLRFSLWNMNEVLGVSVVQADRFSVTWSPSDSISLDTDVFLRAAHVPRTAQSSDTIATLEYAVEIYRGDLLTSFDLSQDTLFAEWLEQQRAVLRELAIGALYYLAQYATTHHHFDQAIATTRRLLALDPWREASHTQLMLTLAIAGERDAALAQYETCCRILKAELGVEPSSETRILYDRILANEIDSLASNQASGTILRFAGRSEEYAALLAEWTASRRGAGKFALVEGEAGSGKTRLIEEVLRHIAGSGARILRGRCYEFSGEVPFQAIADALRSALVRESPSVNPGTLFETRANSATRLASQGGLRQLELSSNWLADLTLLLPELYDLYPDLMPPVHVASTITRQRLFEAIARLVQAIAGRRPLVLFLDDLHWADQDTLDLLQSLVHRLHQNAVWFVGTYRPEETSLGHCLTRLCQGLARENLLKSVPLAKLSDNAIAEIAAGLCDDSHLAQFLQRESGGNPFIMSEVIKELQETGRLQLTRQNRWRICGNLEGDRLDVPERVEDLTLQRVGRLSESERWLLNFAVVLGQPFTLDWLQDIAGDSLAPTKILEAWQSRRLVHSVSGERYDLAHDKIRAAIYHQLDPGLCALFHEHVGLTLFQRAGGHIEKLPYDIAAQVAYHFESSPNSRYAAPYLARAAQAAQEIHANAEATGFYQRLLALLPPDAQIEPLMKLGQLEHATQTATEAEKSYWQALGLAQTANDLPAQARAWSALGLAQIDLGNYTIALERLAKAEQAARSANAPSELAEALSHKSWALYRLGDTQTALRVGEETLALSTTQLARSTQILGLSLRVVCAACMQLSRFDQAQMHMERSLRLHRDNSDREGESRDLNTLGEIARLRGDYRRALEHYTASLNIALELRHPIAAAVRRNNRAGALVGLGDYATAETELRELIAELNDTPLLMETYRFYAEALIGQGKGSEAWRAAQQGLEMAQAAKQKDVLASLWRVLGEITSVDQIEPSQVDASAYVPQDYFAASVRLCEEMGMESERAWTLFAWARYETAQGNHARGDELQCQAQGIAARLGLIVAEKK